MNQKNISRAHSKPALAIYVLAIAACAVFLHFFALSGSYRLTQGEAKLLSSTAVGHGQVAFKKGVLSYNQANQAKDGAQSLTVAGATNSSTQNLYRVTLAAKSKDGITFTDANTNLPFTLTPLTPTGNGRYIDGRMVYPSDGATNVYTLRRNGIKEDIILSVAPGNSFNYSWKLSLGSGLRAQLMSDGGVGIYSANPLLYSSNLQVGDAKSQTLIDKAKQSGAKNTLIYMIPAPFIKDSKGKLTAKNVRFSLERGVLTLTADSLTDPALNYPLTIDPTVVTTTTAQFRLGTDDGNIDYSAADEIDRGAISTGLIGTWNYTHNSTNDGGAFVNGFTNPRGQHATVAYGGYLYILGGQSQNLSDDCSGGNCNGAQYAPINSDGTIGAWHYTHNSTDDGATFVAGFSTPRYDLSAVAYNGYMYVVGGRDNNSNSDDCTNGPNGGFCSGVQYAPINANGTIGTWHYTHNSTDDGTTFVGGFMSARSAAAVVITKGYLYLLGGNGYISSGDCDGGGYCSGVQYAPINANGTIGTWHYTHNSTDDGTTFVGGFMTGRYGLTSVVYNGYIYVIGGGNNSGNSYYNDVQYAPINANGTIGTWHYTHNSTDDGTTFVGGFTNTRGYQAAIVNAGYLYIMGGIYGTGINDSYNDVQYAPINANGTIGTWHYTHNSTDDGTTFVGGFTTQRYAEGGIAYNGYVYVVGGATNTATNTSECSISWCNGVQFAKLNVSPASSAAFSAQSYFTQPPRAYAGTFAYNGYLYMVGGQLSAASTSCKNTGTSTNKCNDTIYAPINANGSIGTWATNSTYFNFPRYYHGLAIYNGYVYISGGVQANTDTNCHNTGISDTYCNDTQYAKINADGTIGTWTTSPNYFNYPRVLPAEAAYNGYLYIIGGDQTATNTTCKNNGDSTRPLCNDVQYAPINADGSIGTWTTNSTYFSVPRFHHSAVAYNGYLYVMGGNDNINDTTTCKGGGDTTPQYCNDVQYAPINADGSIGTWTTSSNYLITARMDFAAFVTNGYLYIAGGEASSSATCRTTGSFGCNDLIYTPISSNGSIGAWSRNSKSFTVARWALGSVAYNGNIYIMGGIEDNSDQLCNNTGTNGTYCNDLQYAPLNSGTPSFGTDGVFSTNSNYFSTPRYGEATFAYNGYFYVVGGSTASTVSACNGGSSTNYCYDIQYASINSDGSLGAFVANPNNILGPRAYAGVTIYNGRIYIGGGYTDTAYCGTPGGSACNDVQYAQINNDGSIGTFNTTAPFMTARAGFGFIAYKGYMYIAGGEGSPPPIIGTADNDVQFAQINTDGTLGPWNYTHASTNDGSTFVSGLPSALAYNPLIAYNGYIYVLGGASHTCTPTCKTLYSNSVYYAPVNSDGTVGSWTTNTAPFITGRYGHVAFANNGYMYVAGGITLSSATDCTTTSFYCNGVQYAQINSDGSVGAWSFTHAGINDGTTFSSGFTTPRYSMGGAVYRGELYISGGREASTDTNCKNTGVAEVGCNDIQYAPINSPEQASTYEKTVDIGGSGAITSLFFNGKADCGAQINYRIGDASGVFGAVNTISAALPGVTYSISQTGRYVLAQFKLNDAVCGGRSLITDFTITYNIPPAAPSLSVPSSGATGVSALPQFQLKTTDADSDYMRYKIDVCSTNNCSSIIRTVDQTTSQTGWSGQDQQGGTAYTGSNALLSSAMAAYAYQVPALSKNTQYWWRAYAIDPGGSNTWSSASSIQTFTTGDDVPGAPTLIYPVSSSHGNSVITSFDMRSTENNSDYLQYWLDICDDSSCGAIVRTVCQDSTGSNLPTGTCSASQSGWSGQDQQSGTAYSGSPVAGASQMAVYTYQFPDLSPNTTYWWRAYAIDPGGSNTWSSASAIQAFTTSPVETHIQGNVKVQGNTTIY